MTHLRVGQSRTPSLSETLRAATAQALNGLFVALPGKVESYNPLTQKANIKPLLKRAYIDDQGNEDLDDLAIIREVPVIFPRGGGFFVSLPLKKNDNVLLLFCDRSIDSFMISTGTVSLDPVDLREHDFADAVALPGFFPTPKIIKDVIGTDAVFGKEKGPQIRVKASTVEMTTKGAPTASDFVAMASLVATELGRIAALFNIATGHIHTDSLGSPTTPPLAAHVPGSVASTNLKAD